MKTMEERFENFEKRLEKVENIVQTTHDSVITLCARINQPGMLSCPVNNEKISNLEKITTQHSSDLEKTKQFQWKTSGVVIAIIILIQIIGPSISELIIPRKPTTDTTVKHSSIVNTNNSVIADIWTSQPILKN